MPKEQFVEMFEPLFPSTWKLCVRDIVARSTVRHVSAEYPAVVIDNGSFSCKAGLVKASDFYPQVQVEMSSVLAFPHGDNVRSEFPLLRRDIDGNVVLERFPAYLIGDQVDPRLAKVDTFEIHPFVFSSHPRSWDDLSTFWACLYDAMAVDPAQHTCVMSYPVLTPESSVQQIAEILFETFSVPSTFLEIAPVLAAYNQSNVTGLFVDIGSSGTQIVPIFQGVVVQSGVRKFPHLGGEACTSVVLDTLLRRGLMHESQQQLQPYYCHYVASEVKRKIALCGRTDMAMAASEASEETLLVQMGTTDVCFTLPERLRIGELFFSPQEILDDYDASIISLPDAITEVIYACPVDIRKDLIANTTVSGGASKMVSFAQRLSDELRQIFPVKNVDVVMADIHAVWKGGASLVALPEFEDRVVTKAAFREEGFRAFRQG